MQFLCLTSGGNDKSKRIVWPWLVKDYVINDFVIALHLRRRVLFDRFDLIESEGSIAELPYECVRLPTNSNHARLTGHRVRNSPKAKLSVLTA